MGRGPGREDSLTHSLTHSFITHSPIHSVITHSLGYRVPEGGSLLMGEGAGKRGLTHSLTHLLLTRVESLSLLSGLLDVF